MLQKVVLVVIDGLGFKTAVDNCGFLEGLVASGKARRWKMRTALPSLSVPLYETLHCGVEPIAHGITSNDACRLSESEHVFKLARVYRVTTILAGRYRVTR